MIEVKKSRSCESQSLTKKSFNRETDRTAAIELSIVKMIASDNMPLRTVESEGFQNLMKTIRPKFNLKSRFYYTEKVLPILVSKIHGKVEEDLKSMDYLSITSDGWSSKHNNHHMLSVTAHWIDKNEFCPKYCVLGCKSVYGKHNSINYVEKVKEKLNTFGIPESKVIRVVKDGASVMTALCDRLDFEGLHCFAHFLQFLMNFHFQSLV